MKRIKSFQKFLKGLLKIAKFCFYFIRVMCFVWGSAMGIVWGFSLNTQFNIV